MPATRRNSGIAVAALGGTAIALSTLLAGPASAAPAATWDKVAQCESGGDWTTSNGNGFYGGLQFTKTSWLGAGGGKYAPTADRATKEQQIAIAESLLALQGPGAWPVCGPHAGLTGGPNPSSAPPATPSPAKTCKVLPGDTLSGIAQKLHIPGGWQALYAKNKAVIPGPNRIYPGQLLTC